MPIEHFRKAHDMAHSCKNDLVVMTVQVMKGPDTGYENIAEQHLFTSYQQLLFSRVVALAEKAGKHVDLLVVPSSNVYQAIVHTAAQLESSEIVAARPSVLAPREQAPRHGAACEEVPHQANRQGLLAGAGASGRA